MHIERHRPVEIARAIKRIVAKYPELREYTPVFFGSRVDGTHHPTSDIDVGLLGPAPIPSAIMGRVREDIENLPYLYTIDIVDLQQTSPAFRTTALAHLEPFP